MEVELLAATPDSQRLIELAGRTAYQSHERVTDDSAQHFIRSLIERGHLSVLEHASATFLVHGASRAFTHQIVRHRLCSFTQESQRYVDESTFTYIEPADIAQDEEIHARFVAFMGQAKGLYVDLQRRGIRNEDARFILPNAVSGQIVITANFRQWRHMIELRGSSHAQWEIRSVVLAILGHLKQISPACFGDYEVDEATQTIRTSR